MYVDDLAKVMEKGRVPHKHCHNCGKAIMPGKPYRYINDGNGGKKPIHDSVCP